MPPDTEVNCSSQATIRITPLLKMGRLRVFLYPSLASFFMDLAQKNPVPWGRPFFSICLWQYVPNLFVDI
jgi:hypothetical protein